jgi:hypothetical protein
VVISLVVNFVLFCDFFFFCIFISIHLKKSILNKQFPMWTVNEFLSSILL